LKEKHILFAAVILFGLVVYYAVFEYGASSETVPEDIGPPILLLDYRAVKKIHVRTHDGKEFIAEQREMSWDLIKGNEAETWNAKVTDFVLYFISAVEIDKIPIEGVELSKFGLETPQYEVTLTDITDKTYQLAIGENTPVRTSVYARFADSPQIIIVGALLNWELSKLGPLFAPV